MINDIVRRHDRSIEEIRQEENFRAEVVKLKDVQDFLLIMAGEDPFEEEETENG